MITRKKVLKIYSLNLKVLLIVLFTNVINQSEGSHRDTKASPAHSDLLESLLLRQEEPKEALLLQTHRL